MTIFMPPTLILSRSSGNMAAWRERDPNEMIAVFWKRELTKNDVTSKVAAGALRTRRKAVRSIRIASAATITAVSASITGHGSIWKIQSE